MRKPKITTLIALVIAVAVTCNLSGCVLKLGGKPSSQPSSGASWGDSGKVLPDNIKSSKPKTGGTSDGGASGPGRPNSSNLDCVGVYHLYKCEGDGQTMQGGDFARQFPADQYYIEIVDSYNIIFVLDGEKMETVYRRSGSLLSVLDGRSILEFTIHENEISYTTHYMTFYFRK
jgi:hypothetical protein